MIYPPIISAFVDENKRQILTKVSSIIFNTIVKALTHDGHICTLRTVILASLLKHTEALKIIAGYANIIKVALL